MSAATPPAIERQFLVGLARAFGGAIVAAATVLLLIGALGPGMSADEIIGKLSLQPIPGSIGALLARSQLGRSDGHPARLQSLTGESARLSLWPIYRLAIYSSGKV